MLIAAPRTCSFIHYSSNNYVWSICCMLGDSVLSKTAEASAPTELTGLSIASACLSLSHFSPSPMGLSSGVGGGGERDPASHGLALQSPLPAVYVRALKPGIYLFRSQLLFPALSPFLPPPLAVEGSFSLLWHLIKDSLLSRDNLSIRHSA